MVYTCCKCKKEIDLRITGRIICPYCGYRIIRKARPTTVKKVKAK